jgi:N-acetylneuraminic acid mutarotase
MSSESKIECTKINVTEGAPSTRWGHAATTNEGKLYILGGRNEQDVCDIFEFNHSEMKWREIEIADPKPKPRRRHSAIFVSGSLIMFGGFDGGFYDDLNILDL